MKSFILAALAGTTIAINPILNEYINYVMKQGKGYSTIEEFTKRFELYFQNDTLIKEHNATNSSFTLGHN